VPQYIDAYGFILLRVSGAYDFILAVLVVYAEGKDSS
jgi:hypothetical protein